MMRVDDAISLRVFGAPVGGLVDESGGQPPEGKRGATPPYLWAGTYFAQGSSSMAERDERRSESALASACADWTKQQRNPSVTGPDRLRK